MLKCRIILSIFFTRCNIWLSRAVYDTSRRDRLSGASDSWLFINVIRVVNARGVLYLFKLEGHVASRTETTMTARFQRAKTQNNRRTWSKAIAHRYTFLFPSDPVNLCGDSKLVHGISSNKFRHPRVTLFTHSHGHSCSSLSLYSFLTF